MLSSKVFWYSPEHKHLIFNNSFFCILHFAHFKSCEKKKSTIFFTFCTIRNSMNCLSYWFPHWSHIQELLSKYLSLQKSRSLMLVQYSQITSWRTKVLHGSLKYVSGENSSTLIIFRQLFFSLNALSLISSSKLKISSIL